MFKLVFKRYRSSTFFEKLLLFVGIAIGIIGFWLINTVYFEEPILSWQFIVSVFLWLILIFIVILTDSNESIKEELGLIMKEHIEETRILKKIMIEHVKETKILKNEVILLNKVLTKNKKK